jgi:hypothetical protein
MFLRIRKFHNSHAISTHSLPIAQPHGKFPHGERRSSDLVGRTVAPKCSQNHDVHICAHSNIVWTGDQQLIQAIAPFRTNHTTRRCRPPHHDRHRRPTHSSTPPTLHTIPPDADALCTTTVTTLPLIARRIQHNSSLRGCASVPRGDRAAAVRPRGGPQLAGLKRILGTPHRCL